MPKPIVNEQILIDWLSDNDAECPGCKYNLRGLREPRCPECGKAIQLSITLVEQYLRAWITALVAACLPAGIGVALVFEEAVAFNAGDFRDILQMKAAEAFLFLTPQLEILLTVILIIVRRRFLAMHRFIQWIVACGLVAIDLALLLAVIHEIR